MSLPKPMARKRRREARINLVMMLALVSLAYVFIDHLTQGLVR